MRIHRFLWCSLVLPVLLVSSLVHGQADEFLLLDYGTNTSVGQAAIDCLGLTGVTTVVVDDVSFSAALAAPPSGGWDAVFVDNPCHLITASSPGLQAYIAGGGISVISYWGMDSDVLLQASYGIAAAVDFFAPMEVVPGASGAGHAQWTTPNPLASVPVGGGASPWFDNGDRYTVGTGTAIGEFTDGTIAIVEDNGGNTIAHGFDYDSLDTDAARRLAANAYEYTLTSSGLGTGSLDCALPNDTCATATPVAPGSVTFYDTTTAVDEGTNPASCGFGANPDVWYEMTAPCDGDYTFDLCSGVAAYDTRLALWSADCLIELACNDDTCGLQSSITYFASAGELIKIQVGGYNGATGQGELTISAAPLAPNDDCSSATAIGDVVDLPFGTGSGCATDSGIDPGCGAGTPIDVWYLYTASCDGDVVIDTFGSGFDTRLSAWPGAACPVPGDLALACNDDTGGLQSEITLAGVSTGDTFYIQVGGFSTAVGSGDLTIQCGSASIVPVTIVSCTADVTGTATVEWVNGQAYDSIDIFVDGVLDQTVGGAATTAVIVGLSPGTHTIDICPNAAGFMQVCSSCDVTVPGDFTGMHVVIDNDVDTGLIDNATAVVNALNNAGLADPVVLVTTIGEVGGNPLTIWNLLGTFPANHAMSAAEGQIICDHILAGTATVTNGGDTWGFDAATAFDLYDGVEDGTALDGNDTFIGMVGLDSGVGLDMTGFDSTYTQDQAGNDWTDQLTAATLDVLGPAAGVIWADDMSGGGTGYNTGVAYSTTDPAGEVISQSFEIGGYDGDQDALVNQYLNFLGFGAPPFTPFLRGDCNNSGTHDIADVINALDTLFPPGGPGTGPVPACVDACDANDSGDFDIADTIAMLDFLFSMGPLYPAPSSPIGVGGVYTDLSQCGDDPTGDFASFWAMSIIGGVPTGGDDGSNMGCEDSAACP